MATQNPVSTSARFASNTSPRAEAGGTTACNTLRRVVIGPATLYLGDSFHVLPKLKGVETVITDPPYGIGYKYRSHDDSPEKYRGMMRQLVPELIRVTDNGPCFVWQSPLWASDWHEFFPRVHCSAEHENPFIELGKKARLGSNFRRRDLTRLQLNLQFDSICMSFAQ